MNNITDKFKNKIRNKISDLNYNTWFRPISKMQVEGNQFSIYVPNKFIADWIGDYYLDVLKEEIKALTDKELSISFEIQDSTIEKTVAHADSPTMSSSAAAIRSKTLEQLNSKFTFDSFVVGSSNQFAHAACKAVADLPGGNYNPLFLYGGVGLGKTHLLHAIGIGALRNRHGLNLIYISAEKFMNELINSIRYEKMAEFRSKYREKCDILLIDDIQFIGGKERTQEEFFHTFNALHESQNQIVVTSDKLPRDIPGIEERLRSRFEWGLIADIQAPDLETRIAIITKKAEAANLRCPNDVAMFLASSIKTNVRELEGSLIRLNAFASLTGAHITVDLAKDVLGNILQERQHVCSIESVQKTVASYFNISVVDIKSQKRIKSFAHPRQIAMYLCKKHIKASFPEIGGKFGGKDHTTVMYAYRKIERLLDSDERLKDDISALERKFLH